MRQGPRTWSVLVATLAALAAFGPAAAAAALAAGAVILASGWIQGRAAGHPGAAAPRLLLVLTETAAVLAALFLGGRLGGHAPPAAMVFFAPAALVLLCLLALNAIGSGPLTVLWTGGCILAGWAAARALVLADPMTLTKARVIDEDYPTLLAYLKAITQPRYFDADVWEIEMAAIAAVALVLVLAAWRTRRLARRAAEQEAARARLAAHFSAPVAELLLSRPDRRQWRQGLAVLDCDLVGFSAWAAARDPQAAAAALRTYHRLAEQAVSAEGGGVLKFSGDGLTALFGLDRDHHRAAARAVACARALAARWQRERPLGEDGPAIAVGVAGGELRAALIGRGRALSLAVTGEAVERAGRLQALTRRSGAAVLVDEAAMQAAAAAGLGPFAPAATAGAWAPG